MSVPANWGRPELSGEATALAVELSERYADMALGRSRIQLYAALNDRQPEQVDLLAQVCFILMERDRLLQIVDLGGDGDAIAEKGLEYFERRSREEAAAAEGDTAGHAAAAHRLLAIEYEAHARGLRANWPPRPSLGLRGV